MKLGTFRKQPNEKRRYLVEYKEALLAGDGIVSATATVDPPGELSAITAHTGDAVTVVCEGGVDGTKYKVTLTVTTTDAHERWKTSCSSRSRKSEHTALADF